MSFIRSRHLKSMLRRELGVFVTNKACKNTKRFVLKKIEEQFIKVINNYAKELKVSNHRNNIEVVFERRNPEELPVFQKIYMSCSC